MSTVILSDWTVMFLMIAWVGSRRTATAGAGCCRIWRSRNWPRGTSTPTASAYSHRRDITTDYCGITTVIRKCGGCGASSGWRYRRGWGQRSSWGLLTITLLTIEGSWCCWWRANWSSWGSSHIQRAWAMIWRCFRMERVWWWRCGWKFE